MSANATEARPEKMKTKAMMKDIRDPEIEQASQPMTLVL